MKVLLFANLALLVGPLSAIMLAQPPTISRLVPSAVAPGRNVDVALLGERLDGITELWTSFPAKWALAPGIENNGKAADKVTLRLTLPRNVQTGIGALRVATAHGASSLRLLMLDDLPFAVSGGEHRSLESAREVSLPIAVDGECPALQSDFYKFTVRAGQRMSVDVVAQRIGSRLDSVVRILDAEGRELSYGDDGRAVGADSRLAYQFDAPGDYFVELRDVRHRGGSEFYYHLRLGNFPLATVAFPLGGQAGSIATFRVAGPAVEGVAPLNVQLPKTGHDQPMWLSVAFPGGQGSGYVAVLPENYDATDEVEPNDQPDAATQFAIPCALNGRFDRPADRDYYQFDVKQGQRMVFSGRTRRLGSPSDLFMRLYDANGSMLAEVEDSGKEEGTINYTFGADGTYRLMVEDLVGGNGEDYVYRISIEPFQPGFSLALGSELIQAPYGGVFVAKVTASRHEYTGPITLAVEGVGDTGSENGMILENNIIAKDQNETDLKVTLPTSLAQGRLLTLRIVGKATVGGAEFVATARTIEAVHKVLPRAPYPPPTLEGLVAVGIGPEFPSFFDLAVDQLGVFFPLRLGASSCRVKIKRLNAEFKDPITVAVEGLPEGISAEAKPVEKGEAEYEVVLTGPKSFPEGVHHLRITGTGTFQNQPKTVVLENVPLHVVQPLVVRLFPAGPIAIGHRQTVKLRVLRFGEERHPVTIQWKEMPSGLSAPGDLIIPPDKDEVDVELTAASDASVGIFDNLVVTAMTQFQGDTIAVESSPARLRITNTR